MKVNSMDYFQITSDTECFHIVFFKEKDTKKVNRFDMKAKK